MRPVLVLRVLRRRRLPLRCVHRSRLPVLPAGAGVGPVIRALRCPLLAVALLTLAVLAGVGIAGVIQFMNREVDR